MPRPQRFVYNIRSEKHPDRYYTGRTFYVKSRLADHNNGHCRHTATAASWRIIVVIAFADDRRARDFERCLKSGSGGAVAAKHFR